MTTSDYVPPTQYTEEIRQYERDLYRMSALPETSVESASLFEPMIKPIDTATPLDVKTDNKFSIAESRIETDMTQTEKVKDLISTVTDKVVDNSTDGVVEVHSNRGRTKMVVLFD